MSTECQVHVPGRDQPSPWCAACRMSSAHLTTTDPRRTEAAETEERR